MADTQSTPAPPPPGTDNGAAPPNAGPDDRDEGAREERQRHRQNMASALLMPSLLSAAALLIVLAPAGAWALLSSRAGLLVWLVSLVGFIVVAMVRNASRAMALRNPPRKQADRERLRLPAPPMRKRMRQWSDALLWRDDPRWRAACGGVTLLVLVVGLSVVLRVPPRREDLVAWRVGACLGAVALWWAVVGGRLALLDRRRAAAAAAIHAIAADTLKYRRAGASSRGWRSSTRQALVLEDPVSAVRVSEWEAPEDGGEGRAPVVPRSFFVVAPPSLSVTDDQAWNEFEKNLNAKFPRPTGWHIERAGDGSGAAVTPAHYPMSVIWDGEVLDDPLEFFIGESLDRQGAPEVLKITQTAPHMLVTGSTGGGKSSLVEVICAQFLRKTMPWDPRAHGTIHLLDPKGPFANRWEGRPGVLVSRGDRDGTNADGDGISGFEVMAAHCDLIEEEHKRRAGIIARYRNAASWRDLPDDVKREEGFAPVLVVIDEFLDIPGQEKEVGPQKDQIARNNAARAHMLYLVTEWARKTRYVGIHLILILQQANMADIGNQLKRNATMRIIMGPSDKDSYIGMFATPEPPVLPSMRKVVKIVDGIERTTEEPIAGRGLVQYSTGQEIHRIQSSWFGGGSNSATLDKWLPRDPDPAAGRFDGDTARARMASMPDRDGNGIPDTWQPLAPQAGGDGGGGEALFPAADGGVAPPPPRAPQCAWGQCSSPASATCPKDGLGYCSEHCGPSPDPDEEGVFGQAYLEAHPLVAADAVELYEKARGIAAQGGLPCAWAPVAGDDGPLADAVQIRISSPQGKTVAIIMASPERVSAQTAIERSGVAGAPAALEAARAAVAARGGAS